MRYIYTFKNEKEQLEAMDQMFDYIEPIVSGNLETNKILLTKNATKDKIYKYVDKDNNILKDYLSISRNYETDLNVAPLNANKIVVKDEITNEIIRYDKLTIKSLYERPLYKVGLISDVHYNDTDNLDEDPDTFTDDGAEYSEDLKNALQYFNDHDVNFVCCSGDISTDKEEHLINYMRCINTYGNEITVYTCSGNHDTAPKFYNLNLWKETAIQNNDYNIHYSEGDKESSYYFIKTLPSGAQDIYIFLDVDYGNGENDSYYHTHLPRLLRQDELLMHNEVKEYDYHLYNKETLLWLANVLEEYKDNRCFIFTHLMFDEYAGTYHKDDYFNYSTGQVDIIKRHYDQGEYLYNLLENYQHNYWFSGHSHYKWLWHKIDNKMNVSKTNNNSYTIHIPSLARPLKYGTTYYHANIKDSEAGLMDVYENYVVLNGLVLKDNEYDNKIEGPEDNEYEYVTAEMFTDFTDDSYVINDEDNYITITLNSVHDMYFNPNNIINHANCTNAKFFIKVEDVYIYSDDINNDITWDVINEQRIGFRDTTTSSSNYLYHLEDGNVFDVYQYGILFKKSSVSQYANSNVTVKIKMKYCIKFEKYLNKILPIAIYKLNS